MSLLPTWAGSKISNAPEIIGFAASLMYMKLRREFKGDYMDMGKSKAGLNYRLF